MTEKFLCNKCRVNFTVGPKRGESTMCSAPDCRVRFWHVNPKPGEPGAAPVGITPEDAAALKATGEIAA